MQCSRWTAQETSTERDTSTSCPLSHPRNQIVLTYAQPFDIVKVRIQTAAPGTFASPLDCAAKLLKNEGPLGFYKVSLWLGSRRCGGARRGASKRGAVGQAGRPIRRVRMRGTVEPEGLLHTPRRRPDGVEVRGTESPSRLAPRSSPSSPDPPLLHSSTPPSGPRTWTGLAVLLIALRNPC